jgi:hypothetical protein
MQQKKIQGGKKSSRFKGMPFCCKARAVFSFLCLVFLGVGDSTVLGVETSSLFAREIPHPRL